MDPVSFFEYALGPLGALVVALLLVFGFYSGRLRPGKDYDDCKRALDEKDQRYAQIVPALENFAAGSKALAETVEAMDYEIQSVKREHAQDMEALKSALSAKLDESRMDTQELVKVIGQMNGDLRVIGACVDRIETRGSPSWKA